MRHLTRLALAVLTLIAVTAHAQTAIEPVIKFYVPEVDGLSRSIALYQDTALLGSIDPQVLAFQRQGGTWWMDPIDLPGGSGLFMEVAVSENVALIGVQPNAYVFRFDGARWMLEKTLVDSLGDPEFGHTVAIDGELAVVGTRSVDAQVFRYVGGDWVLEARLAPPRRADGKYPYGYADDVEVSGDRVLVSKSQTIGDKIEGIYSFRYDGAGWYREDFFTLTEVEDDTVFHGDIALDGDVALVDADYDDVVHVFAFDGASWGASGDSRAARDLEPQLLVPPHSYRRSRALRRRQHPQLRRLGGARRRPRPHRRQPRRRPRHRLRRRLSLSLRRHRVEIRPHAPGRAGCVMRSELRTLGRAPRRARPRSPRARHVLLRSAIEWAHDVHFSVGGARRRHERVSQRARAARGGAAHRGERRRGIGRVPHAGR